MATQVNAVGRPPQLQPESVVQDLEDDVWLEELDDELMDWDDEGEMNSEWDQDWDE